MDSRSQSASQARQAIAGRRMEFDVYDDSCLHVEHKKYFVAVKGTPIKLTKTEFRVLSRLVQSIDRIVPLKDLWDFGWGSGKPFNIKSIHVFVSRVRSRVSPFGLQIDSMVGVGYILSHGACCSKESERQVHA